MSDGARCHYCRKVPCECKTMTVTPPHPNRCRCLLCVPTGERPTNDPPCIICGKPKGQPPQRCPGHYEMPPLPPGDTAPQPPPGNPPSRYKGRCDVHGLHVCDECQYGETDAKLLTKAKVRIAELEAELAEERERADALTERHSVAQETIAVLRDEFAEAQLGETAQTVIGALVEKRSRYIRQLEEKIARQREDLRKEKGLREEAEKNRRISLEVNAKLRDEFAEAQARLAMAVETLSTIRSQRCDFVGDFYRKHPRFAQILDAADDRDRRKNDGFDTEFVKAFGEYIDSALTPSAPAVAEFIATVERRGAAKATELLDACLPWLGAYYGYLKVNEHHPGAMVNLITTLQAVLRFLGNEEGATRFQRDMDAAKARAAELEGK